MTLRYGSTRRMKSVSSKIPAELHDKLLERHPRNGDVSRLLRALIQMYLEGKIQRPEFKYVDSL